MTVFIRSILVSGYLYAGSWNNMCSCHFVSLSCVTADSEKCVCDSALARHRKRAKCKAHDHAHF